MHGRETRVMDGWDWIWMTPMMLSWIALIVLAVYVGVRLANGRPGNGPADVMKRHDVQERDERKVR